MAVQLDKTWIQLLLVLSKHVDSKIASSDEHSARVAHWTKMTAITMGCTDLDAQSYYWAALFHDIGKIGVPDGVLIKPGPLTEDEWIVMKLHPDIGANIIKVWNLIEHTAPVIQYHQEKYDGNGYPRSLKGEDIPLGARILSVVDAYDAMTTNRVYRQALSRQEAIIELRTQCGKHFDPKVVEAFLGIVNPKITH